VHQAKGLDGMPKRAFDIAFSGSFLLLAWPLLLAIAAGVKIGSRGPILFRQTRYGRDGARIQVLKFRTMTVTEDGATVKQATKDDVRVTRFGAFLRRTSLDELPQFINVLRGEMSVVGPRPHAVAHNEEYRTRILEYALRHKVKPGITGYAQVNGWRGETDTLDKMIQRVTHDLEYIRRQSLWLDVRIIFSTVFGRRSKENAY
jgi:putative colanic acid biosysnthesis UDP-glucose lipid carrier transferase